MCCRVDGGVGAFLERHKVATADKRKRARVKKAECRANKSPGAKARVKDVDRSD